jgi:hypothetical protein
MTHDELLARYREGFPVVGLDGKTRRVNVSAERYVALCDGDARTYIWFDATGKLVGGVAPPPDPGVAS